MNDMPERVRLGRWPGGRIDCVEDSDEDGTDYIRADLYEQAEAAIAALEARIASMIGDGTHQCTRCGVQYTPAAGDSEDCPACGYDGGEYE